MLGIKVPKKDGDKKDDESKEKCESKLNRNSRVHLCDHNIHTAVDKSD